MESGVVAWGGAECCPFATDEDDCVHPAIGLKVPALRLRWCRLSFAGKAWYVSGANAEEGGRQAHDPHRKNSVPRVKGAGQGIDEADWRAALRRHAAAIRQGASSRPPSLSQPDRARLTERFGERTDDVIGLAEAFAIGFRTASGEGQARSDDSFARGLALLLEALGGLARAGGGAQLLADRPPHMIQSELWQVLHRIRESADLSYSREIDLNELDRRILFLLQAKGPLPPADISSAMGVDKAQVSRSVKRLLELDIAQRRQLRSPLGLTRKGEEVGRRLARLAELRNRELTFDISDEELAEFFSTVEILLDRAVALYDLEREQVQGPIRIGKGAAMLEAAEEHKPTDRIAIDRSRIISPLLTLSAYFSRSGALAYRRLAGLSAFEAFVMSEIGRNPPIEWSDLVVALQRDHSQAGRTVNALMDRHLVERHGKPGRRHGRFNHTEEGARLYDIIKFAAQERSEFLLAPLVEHRRMRFLEVFEKIRRNAVAQLERERAFAELAQEQPGAG